MSSAAWLRLASGARGIDEDGDVSMSCNVLHMPLDKDGCEMNREEVSLQGNGSSSPNVDGMFSKHMHTHTTPRGSLGAKKALLPIHPHPFPRPGRRRLAPCIMRGREFGSLVWFHHVGSSIPSIHPGCGSKAEWTPLEVHRRAEGTRRGSSSQPRDF